MRVKVGDTWYRSFEQPIMVQLTPSDRERIMDMPQENDRYCSYQKDDFTSEGIIEWMNAGYKSEWNK